MRRRRLLTALGATMTGLGGCANTPSREPTATPSGATAAADATPLEETGCPPYAPDVGDAICSPTVDTGSASVSLLPSAVEAESAASLTLTLYNDSESPLTFNPYSWTLVEHRKSGWTWLERQSSGSGTVTVDPGSTHAWPFSVVLTYFDGTEPLSPGLYAAEISVPDPDSPDRLRLVAVFGLA